MATASTATGQPVLDTAVNVRSFWRYAFVAQRARHPGLHDQQGQQVGRIKDDKVRLSAHVVLIVGPSLAEPFEHARMGVADESSVDVACHDAQIVAGAQYGLDLVRFEAYR